MNTTDILSIWLPLVVAGLVQASFSLGVSMLTLLSGHLLGGEQSRSKLNRLSAAYVFGSLLTILSGLIGATYLFSQLGFTTNEKFWSVLAGGATGVGLGVLLFYYRWGKHSGTRLWLPRRAAEYLYARTKATKYGFEAFLLGVGAIVAELIFIIAPLLIAANIATELSGSVQLCAILLYTLIAMAPMFILQLQNRRGRPLSHLQEWREKNKKFLQVAAGLLLILLGLYMLIFKTL
jgi:cytochrome c biogenesis protein CcdA